MSADKIKRLKELASKATFESSIWESEEDAPQAWRDNRENNAAWCRAANPQAVLELIERLEESDRLTKLGLSMSQCIGVRCYWSHSEDKQICHCGSEKYKDSVRAYLHKHSEALKGET